MFFIKKILCFVLLISNLVLFSACQKQNDNYLAYQNGNITAEITADYCGQKFVFNLEKTTDNNLELTVIKPESLSNCKLISKNGELFLKVSDTEIPLPEAKNKYPVEKINKLLSLSKEEAVDFSTDTVNGVEVNKVDFSGEDYKATLYLSPETNFPVIIEGVFDSAEISLFFNSFESKCD